MVILMLNSIDLITNAEQLYQHFCSVRRHLSDYGVYVIEGDLAVYLQGKGWLEAERGSYIYIPGGIEHGFENRSDSTVGFMSINTPGGFEKSIPQIVHFFEENPLGDAKTST